MYFIEGLSYQYWRVTALLRVLGKGTTVTFDAAGNWTYSTSDELDDLFRSIDMRTQKENFDSSLIGVWFTNDITKEASANQVIISPQYNVYKKPLRDIFARFGIELPSEFIANCVPAVLDVHAYLEAHQRFSEAVFQRHGFHLATLIHAIWALGTSSLITRRIANESSESEQLRRFGEHLLNMCQRGYRIMSIGQDIKREVNSILAVADEGFQEVPEGELERAISHLMLSHDVQKLISLWSGGPRHMLVPMRDEHVIVDLHPISAILRSLFFRTQHDQSLRGTLFEEEFRRSIKAIDLDCISGVLRSPAGGPRELDAGVEVGGQLFLFECVSVELPLDYEIGKPDTIIGRRERLEKKVDQVLSLAEFIKGNPIGNNYAFKAHNIVRPFVVSPFCEWIGERSARLWDSPDVPRILSAREAIELLKASKTG